MRICLTRVVAMGATIAAFGWMTQASAQTTCPGGAVPSAAGICPVFISGDPRCVDVVNICKLGSSFNQEFRSPPTGAPSPDLPNFQVLVTVNTDSSLRVQDVSTPPSQQFGIPGYEALIVRRNGANVYCGINVLDDDVRGPGSGTPSQLTVCWAPGPCGLSEQSVTDACAEYNPDASTRTADFLDAFRIGPIEQAVNTCGCPDNDGGGPFTSTVAQFCDPREPILNTFGDPRFVACNPNDAPLSASEAISLSTEGNTTCIWQTIGGRRMLVDKDGTDPNC